MFHAFLESNLPDILPQPAVEEQRPCALRKTREVHIFDPFEDPLFSIDSICGLFDREEGNEMGSSASYHTYGDNNDYYDYYYINHNGSANLTAYDLPYDDHRDINESVTPNFDLESKDYHCLDLVMTGSELAGITVLQCNSDVGAAGQLTKCCPRFVTS